jgi:RNA polymerase sigma factor (TIGR02999 family)
MFLMADAAQITELLVAYRDGDDDAFAALVALVYPELRRLARQQLLTRGRPDPHVLDTTGLVHETYLKLIDQKRATWRNRGHFLAIAACAMRQVIVDHARARLSQKRGGGAPHVPLEERDLAIDAHAEFLLAMTGVLDDLSRSNPRMLRVIECRFFAGYSEEETAAALAVSTKTIEREWREAKGFLREALARPEAPLEPGTGRSSDTIS